MEKKVWELPAVIDDGNELHVYTVCYTEAVREIQRLELYSKEIVVKHNRLVNDLEVVKAKLASSEDHYDSMLEKILDKI